MDSNHRPSDYESGGIIAFLSFIVRILATPYFSPYLVGGTKNVSYQNQKVSLLLAYLRS